MKKPSWQKATGDSKMAQQGKFPPANSNGLSLIPRIHMVEGEDLLQ